MKIICCVCKLCHIILVQCSHRSKHKEKTTAKVNKTVLQNRLLLNTITEEKEYNEEEECEGEGGAAHCAVLCLCWVLFSLLC